MNRLVFEITLAGDVVVVDNVASLMERMAEAMREELALSRDKSISFKAGRGITIGRDSLTFSGSIQ